MADQEVGRGQYSRDELRAEIACVSGRLQQLMGRLLADLDADRREEEVVVPAGIPTFSPAEIRDRSIQVMQSYKHSEISLNAAFFQLCDVVYGLAAAVAEMDKGRSS